jgi:hypothetical protein
MGPVRAAAVLLAMLGAGTTAFVTVASGSDDPVAGERPASALGERGSTTTRAGERLTLVPEPEPEPEPEPASPTESGTKSTRAAGPEPTDTAPEATQRVVPSPTVTEELVEATGAATTTAPIPSPSPETATTSTPQDDTAPETSLWEDHPDGRTAVFSFSADEAASFSCSLDGGSWTSCASPTTYSDLGSGWHTFAVRATDGSGNVDATPAETDWKANGSPGSDD